MISSVLVFKGNRPTDWGPDRGGGGGGGSRSGGGVQVKDLLSNTFFCIGGIGGKFSQIFSNFLGGGGCQIGGGCWIHF